MNGQEYLSRIAIAKIHADIHMFNKKKKNKTKTTSTKYLSVYQEGDSSTDYGTISIWNIMQLLEK